MADTETNTRQKAEPTESIHIKVPRTLFREVKLLLMDPKNGRVRYGEMSKLATTLLRGWVDEKRIEGTKGDDDDSDRTAA